MRGDAIFLLGGKTPNATDSAAPCFSVIFLFGLVLEKPSLWFLHGVMERIREIGGGHTGVLGEKRTIPRGRRDAVRFGSRTVCLVAVPRGCICDMRGRIFFSICSRGS